MALIFIQTAVSTSQTRGVLGVKTEWINDWIGFHENNSLAAAFLAIFINCLSIKRVF